MSLSFANARLERAYFFKVNQELIKAMHESDKVRADLEGPAAPGMKCPKCGHDLKPTQVASMLVERCMGCEGVFFEKEEWNELFGPPKAAESFISTLHTLLVGEGNSY